MLTQTVAPMESLPQDKVGGLRPSAQITSLKSEPEDALVRERQRQLWNAVQAGTDEVLVQRQELQKLKTVQSPHNASSATPQVPTAKSQADVQSAPKPHGDFLLIQGVSAALVGGALIWLMERRKRKAQDAVITAQRQRLRHLVLGSSGKPPAQGPGQESVQGKHNMSAAQAMPEVGGHAEPIMQTHESSAHEAAREQARTSIGDAGLFVTQLIELRHLLRVLEDSGRHEEVLRLLSDHVARYPGGSPWAYLQFFDVALRIGRLDLHKEMCLRYKQHFHGEPPSKQGGQPGMVMGLQDYPRLVHELAVQWAQGGTKKLIEDWIVCPTAVRHWFQLSVLHDLLDLYELCGFVERMPQAEHKRALPVDWLDAVDIPASNTQFGSLSLPAELDGGGFPEPRAGTHESANR